jgi:hypothetical protein
MLAQELLPLARNLGFEVRVDPFGREGFEARSGNLLLSIIWHEGSYSGGRFGPPAESETVEFWDGKSDRVEGWVPATYVAATLGKLAPRVDN